MPRTCTICTHEQRAAIELALCNATPLRDIAGQFQVSKDALARHRRETNETPTPFPNATAKRSKAQQSWNKLERVSLAEKNATDATDAPPIALFARNATDEPSTTSTPKKRESNLTQTLPAAAQFAIVHPATGNHRVVTGKYWLVFGEREQQKGWQPE